MIILEILTRQPATKALNTLKTNTSRGTEHSMQPQNLHIDVPKELAEVLNRALADNPHQRFSSIEEMNRAFQIAIGSETVPKPEVAHETPIPLLCIHHPGDVSQPRRFFQKYLFRCLVSADR
jgi:serine/threonine protein kinase